MAANNKVLGNLVGTKKDGTSALGNSNAGVSIFGILKGTARNNLVGGATAASVNTIAFNGGEGVEIFGISASNRVLRNSIFSNARLGIDLGSDGPTAKDVGDVDTGPNGLQNKPAIASAKTSGGQTTIEGNLTTKPNKTFMVRFFSNPSGEKARSS